MQADIGPAIVATAQTLFVANQVFEMIGGMLQAHLNVEAVRHFTNAVHWGDTLLFFLRRLMLDLGLEPLWQTRLRSFGAYDGVLSFRHDVHGMRDYNFLDYQIQNLIPASYDIETPSFSKNIDEAMARDWVKRTTLSMPTRSMRTFVAELSLTATMIVARSRFVREETSGVRPPRMALSGTISTARTT